MRYRLHALPTFTRCNPWLYYRAITVFSYHPQHLGPALQLHGVTAGVCRERGIYMSLRKLSTVYGILTENHTDTM